MKGKIELYNISFLILKVELHFNGLKNNIYLAKCELLIEKGATSVAYVFIYFLSFFLRVKTSQCVTVCNMEAGITCTKL